MGPSHELAVLEYEERETVQMSIHAPDSGERGRKYKVLDLWNFGEEVTTGTPLLKLESIYT